MERRAEEIKGERSGFLSVATFHFSREEVVERIAYRVNIIATKMSNLSGDDDSRAIAADTAELYPGWVPSPQVYLGISR